MTHDTNSHSTHSLSGFPNLKSGVLSILLAEVEKTNVKVTVKMVEKKMY